MKTSPIYLDRLEKALRAQGLTLKRSQLLEIAAASFGYHNSNEFSAAAKRGDLTPPAALPIGRLSLPDGQAVVIVTDQTANAPYALDEAFVEQVVDDERAERIGVTPYGHLANLTAIGSTIIPELGAPVAHSVADLARQIGDMTCIDADDLPLALEALSDIRSVCAAAERLTPTTAPAPVPAAVPVPTSLVHVATIEHANGRKFLMATTEADLTRQIADFCRSYWDEAGTDAEAAEIQSMDEQAVIDLYFNSREDEFYHTGVIKNAPVAPPAPVAPTFIEDAVQLTLHVASLTHKHGSAQFVSVEEADLRAQVAAFCREYWSELPDYVHDDVDDLDSLSDDDVISNYFENHHHDGIDFGATSIALDAAFAKAVVAKHPDFVTPLVINGVTLPPVESLKAIADTLRESSAADIWHDTGCDDDGSAFNSIESAQCAMGDAARILGELATAEPGLVSRLALHTAPAKKTEKEDEVVWLTDSDGAPTFAGDRQTFDRLGLQYRMDGEKFLALTEDEFSIVGRQGCQFSGLEGYTVILGESVLTKDRKWHAPYIDIEWDEYDPHSIQAAERELEGLFPLVDASARALGGWAESHRGADSRHTLQVFLPFSVAAQAKSPEDYFRALDYLFNSYHLLDEDKAIARFIPQAWINDWAVECDAEGHSTFDVSFEIIFWGATRDNLKNGDWRDRLQDAHLAPEWVRAWKGPFDIRIKLNPDAAIQNLLPA